MRITFVCLAILLVLGQALSMKVRRQESQSQQQQDQQKFPTTAMPTAFPTLIPAQEQQQQQQLFPTAKPFIPTAVPTFMPTAFPTAFPTQMITTAQEQQQQQQQQQQQLMFPTMRPFMPTTLPTQMITTAQEMFDFSQFLGMGQIDILGDLTLLQQIPTDIFAAGPTATPTSGQQQELQCFLNVAIQRETDLIRMLSGLDALSWTMNQRTVLRAVRNNEAQNLRLWAALYNSLFGMNPRVNLDAPIPMENIMGVQQIIGMKLSLSEFLQNAFERVNEPRARFLFFRGWNNELRNALWFNYLFSNALLQGGQIPQATLPQNLFTTCVPTSV